MQYQQGEGQRLEASPCSCLREEGAPACRREGEVLQVVKVSSPAARESQEFQILQSVLTIDFS